MDLNRHFSGTNSNIPFARTVLSNISDPQHTDIGRQFISALDSSGCLIEDIAPIPNIQEQKDFSSAAPATFFAFNYYGREVPEDRVSFFNRIKIRRSAKPREVAISVVHEGIHAAQWQAPVLHASPYNGKYPEQTAFVLCPHDWIRLTLLTEQEAFAKQAWFTSLAAETDRGFYEASKANPVSARRFEEIRKETPDIQSALVTAANEALLNWHHKNPSQMSFGQYYAEDALKSYEESLRLEQPGDIVFVRTELDDILNIGETVGPNIFANNSLLGRGNLKEFITQEIEKRIEILNARLGIKEEENLPAFKEALASKNYTPETFLAWSKNPYKDKPKPAISPAPEAA